MTIERADPLTPLQLGMLFQALARPGSGTDLEQIVGELDEALDVGAFRRAFAWVADREPRFRTFVDPKDGGAAEQVVVSSATLEVREEDLSASTAERQAERLEAYLAADRAQGFDLKTPPLSRVAVFRLGPERFRVVWTVHHILLDGWSFPLVLGAVFAAYRALRDGRPLAAPPVRPFHAELPRLLARDPAADEAFWRPRVAGLAEVGGLLAPGDGADPRATLVERLDAATTQRVKDAAAALDVRPSTLLYGAWALVLARQSGQAEAVFGVTSAGRTRGVDADVVGVFIHTLPWRVPVNPAQPIRDWLGGLRAEQRARKGHERAPLADIQRWAGLPSGRGLFESLVVFDDESLDRMLARDGDPAWARRRFHLVERTGYPLTLYARIDDAAAFELVFDPTRLPAARAKSLLGQLARALASIAERPRGTVGELELLSPAERDELSRLAAGPKLPIPATTIHDLVYAAARRHPDRIALVCRERRMSYRELEVAVDRLAARLVELGVGPDRPVGLSASRSIEMVVGMLAILRAGGAYVPLDPSYPADRLEFMLADSGAAVLVADRPWDGFQRAERREGGEAPAAGSGFAGPIVRVDAPPPVAAPVELSGRSGPEHLAYVIYTSGSTGKPKGVMIEHRNVINFFEGMDRDLRPELSRAEGPGTWLAVTSPSFDISVLELLYTLTRGFTVVVAADEDKLGGGLGARGMEMSLFYFAADQGAAGREKYRLLLEGAKFADERGFAAVWTPERHFHAFGGLYPNPAVTAAAVAVTTNRVKIRAGSVVVPLHDPIRIAEEWSVVDNLSGGRVEVSVASGWHPDDFVFNPSAHARRKEAMLEGLAEVQKLWRGESITRPGPGGRTVELRTLPRPVQPELPVFVTAAGNPETFRQAGALGANVLTHLLGQRLETVAANVAEYRRAWQAAGHRGRGHVALMLHTYVGDDDASVRATVKEPMKAYLKTSVDLVKGFANEWTAYARRAGATAPKRDALDDLSPEEVESLLDYAFERFYEGSALFGTPERCAEMIREVGAIDVDEIACLVDFGVPIEDALAHLEHLDRTRALVKPRPEADDFSLSAQLRRHRVSHLQCTPSMARMLLSDRDAAEALSAVSALMIGGEAFPVDLAADLRARGRGRVINMYGPTETTIWSSTHELREDGPVPIGRPIANTTLWVLDARGQLMPRGLPGELYIGGDGVVRGYHQRPELTRERFVPDPYSAGGRLYRTGDLARWRDDGTLEFLGRIDHQVKIRGHRIELGEIEAAIGTLPGVREMVVVARQDRPGDQRLVAYVVRSPEGKDLDAVRVKDHLGGLLPSFMVPQHVVFLEALPQTPNKKIDRKALPAPEAVGTEAAAEFVAPAGALEVEISAIWREVLGLDRIGTKDNFFDLGGHSILAVQVHGRVQKLLGRTMPITDLFRFPTVSALAAHLGGGEEGKAKEVDRGEDRGKARRAMLARRRGES